MSARFTVTWDEGLLHDVAERWVNSPAAHRRRLTEVADCIDRLLRYAPERRGFVVNDSPSFRLWRVPEIEPPALAVFHVRSEDRIVTVLQIILLP